MNISKLKLLLITACCFVVALCLEIKSMDTVSGLQETTSLKDKRINSEGCLDSLKFEVDSNPSNAQLLLNEDENKDPEISWVSYMSYPVKAVVHGTYKIVNFTVKHPTQAIVTSLLIAQFAAVTAYCNCMYISTAGGAGAPVSVGIVSNETACKDALKGLVQYHGCY